MTTPPTDNATLALEEYDLVVMGSGEGSKFLAWTFARQGQRVAMVERKWIGGSCPNIACLPSKNIVHSGTYSGVFTLLPLLSGNGRANHGHILEEAGALANANRLKPLLAEQDFGTDIACAYGAVAKGSKGKVVLELF